jgi:hypothetical protein
MEGWWCMSTEVFLYAVVAWVVLLLLALTNGVIRNKFYEHRLDNLIAHYISVFTLVLLISIVSYFLVLLCTPPMTPSGAIGVGGVWVACSLLFEFGAGHYFAGMKWKQLLADYDISRGRLLGLVIVAQLAGPWVVFHLLHH